MFFSSLFKLLYHNIIVIMLNHMYDNNKFGIVLNKFKSTHNIIRCWFIILHVIHTKISQNVNHNVIIKSNVSINHQLVSLCVAHSNFFVCSSL